MELEGAKSCFEYLQRAGLAIKVFVSDRHRGIAKWIKDNNPSVTHFFDQWHIVKGVAKKLLAASKEKGCEVIGEWIKAVKNHIYWCSTSTRAGFQDLILAKWKSFMQHVSNKHSDHPDALFTDCAHDDDIEPRKWIKVGMIIPLLICSKGEKRIVVVGHFIYLLNPPTSPHPPKNAFFWLFYPPIRTRISPDLNPSVLSLALLLLFP